MKIFFCVGKLNAIFLGISELGDDDIENENECNGDV
jgi:hypothetical protein